MKKESIKNKIPMFLLLLGILAIAVGASMVFLNTDNSDKNEENNNVVDKEDEDGNNQADEDGNDAEDKEDENSDVAKPNVNENVVGDKELGELKFTNSSLLVSESGSTLTTIVQNTSDQDIEVRMFTITVKDEEGNVITTLDGYVGGVIPANESREITSSVDINLENASDIEYQLNN